MRNGIALKSVGNTYTPPPPTTCTKQCTISWSGVQDLARVTPNGANGEVKIVDGSFNDILHIYLNSSKTTLYVKFMGAAIYKGSVVDSSATVIAQELPSNRNLSLFVISRVDNYCALEGGVIEIYNFNVTANVNADNCAGGTLSGVISKPCNSGSNSLPISAGYAFTSISVNISMCTPTIDNC